MLRPLALLLALTLAGCGVDLDRVSKRLQPKPFRWGQDIVNTRPSATPRGLPFGPGGAEGLRRRLQDLQRMPQPPRGIPRTPPFGMPGSLSPDAERAMQQAMQDLMQNMTPAERAEFERAMAQAMEQAADVMEQEAGRLRGR